MRENLLFSFFVLMEPTMSLNWLVYSNKWAQNVPSVVFTLMRRLATGLGYFDLFYIRIKVVRLILVFNQNVSGKKSKMSVKAVSVWKICRNSKTNNCHLQSWLVHSNDFLLKQQTEPFLWTKLKKRYWYMRT